MKRIFPLLLSLLLLVSFCGCNNASSATPNNGTIDNSDNSQETNHDNSDADITEPEITAPSLSFGTTIVAGDDISAAITTDGKLLTAGELNYGYGSNIISLAAYSDHLVALKSDNTVSIYTKSGYRNEMYDIATIKGWSDIVEVAAGSASTFGIRADGTVVGAGYSPDDFETIATWSDIVAIDTYGYNYCVGLKADGTVVCDNSKLDLSGWTDITAISAQSGYVLGLKADGTVAVIGDSKNPCTKVGDWTDIVAICAGLNHAVGLKADGTVVSTRIENEDYDWGQTDVSGWTNIVAISANYTHTIGLKADGTMVLAGDPDDHEMIGTWENIAIP